MNLKLKSSYVYSALVLSPILVTLVFFNSCEGEGFAPMEKASTCAAELPSLTSKVSLQRMPSPFQSSKLFMGSSSGVQSQKLKQTELAKGTKLAILTDNECLEDLKKIKSFSKLSSSTIDYKLSKKNTKFLKKQAHSVVLDDNTDITALEAQLDQNPCIIGAGISRRYKKAALNDAFNDPFVSNQSHLSSVGADNTYFDYFNNQKGLATLDAANSVVVAVLDTGLDYRHEDIAPSLWTHADGVGLNVISLYDNDPAIDYDPINIDPHGTHVAGLAVAKGNNSRGGSGIFSSGSKIMAVNVFFTIPDANGDPELDSNGNPLVFSATELLVDGINWATEKGAKVINLSLGSEAPEEDGVLQVAIQAAVDAGVVVVIAAGNAGAQLNDNGFSFYPAHYAHLISGALSVGSYDTKTGLMSIFSNYSQKHVEIAAPGAELSTARPLEGLYSTMPANSYDRMPGTSMASPLVAGAAGLIIGMVKANYGVEPTPQEVESLLLAGSQKSAQLAPYIKNGNKLNLNNLLAELHSRYPLTSLSVSGGQTDLSSRCQ